MFPRHRHFDYKVETPQEKTQPICSKVRPTGLNVERKLIGKNLSFTKDMFLLNIMTFYFVSKAF